MTEVKLMTSMFGALDRALAPRSRWCTVRLCCLPTAHGSRWCRRHQLRAGRLLARVRGAYGK